MTRDSITLGDALATQYVTHGLPPDGGASQAWFRIHLGPVTLRLPNPPARRRAVFFHDANHILTGYDTVFSRGEMEIAAYEVGTGCGVFGFAWLINLHAFALGIIVRPRFLFRAFVRGSRALSMYRRQEPHAELSAMTVGDLRAQIRLDRDSGAPRLRERWGFGVWSVAAVATMVAPAAVVIGAVAIGIVRLARAFRG